MKKSNRTASHSIAFASAGVFTNVDAQDFAFRVSQRGVAELLDTLAARTARSRSRGQRIVAACELLAEANGHADAAAGRSLLVEEWLFESGYVPDEATTKLAVRRLDRLLAEERSASDLDVPVDLMRNLRARLALPPRRVKRQPPKADRAGFRELATWLNVSQGEVDDGPQFDRQGNARVVLVHLTVNGASKLINYRKVSVLELWLNNHNDPQELAAAIRILLRGWRGTLQTIEFDQVPDATISREERRSPYRALAKCRNELADLPVMQSLTIQNMYFDDDTLLAVCRNPRLRDISISNARISASGFRRMANCKTLERIFVSRCPKIGEADRDYLAARLPKVQYVTIRK